MMNSSKIMRGLFVALVIVLLALFILIGKGLHFILKMRAVLNENITCLV
jgi:sensor domain CHASE-containing protein